MDDFVVAAGKDALPSYGRGFLQLRDATVLPKSAKVTNVEPYLKFLKSLSAARKPVGTIWIVCHADVDGYLGFIPNEQSPDERIHMRHGDESGRLNLPSAGICTFGESPCIADRDAIDADVAVRGAPFGSGTQCPVPRGSGVHCRTVEAWAHCRPGPRRV